MTESQKKFWIIAHCANVATQLLDAKIAREKRAPTLDELREMNFHNEAYRRAVLQLRVLGGRFSMFMLQPF